MSADSLRLSVAAVEVKHLALSGTLPGVVPLLAAARCGPGAALLAQSVDGAGNVTLRFRAPGSATYGAAVAAVDGEHVLGDGEDADKFLRVEVHEDYLLPGERTAVVMLSEVFNNGVGSDDVTAAEAAAGDIETTSITLENPSIVHLANLRVWVDPLVARMEVSEDGSSWSAPTDEDSAVTFPDLAPGATDTLHLRRTIAAGEQPDPRILNLLHIAFSGP